MFLFIAKEFIADEIEFVDASYSLLKESWAIIDYNL